MTSQHCSHEKETCESVPEEGQWAPPCSLWVANSRLATLAPRRASGRREAVGLIRNGMEWKGLTILVLLCWQSR